MVLLFHGYAAEKGSMQPEARAFLKMGLSVLLVDFRGSGESSGSHTTVGFEEGVDVARSLAFARTNWPGHPMILYGQSMGAAAILRAIHAHGARPDGIVLEAVFNNMLDTVRHRFEAMGVPSFPCAELLVFWGGQQAGFDAFNHNPVEYAAAVECPTLFLHGTDDPRARVNEARQVFDAISGPKHFQSFPQLGHEPALRHHPEDWHRVLTPFLRTVE
jgi:alpha-beta hydrolase superfamily lysophospholipase